MRLALHVGLGVERVVEALRSEVRQRSIDLGTDLLATGERRAMTLPVHGARQGALAVVEACQPTGLIGAVGLPRLIKEVELVAWPQILGSYPAPRLVSVTTTNWSLDELMLARDRDR